MQTRGNKRRLPDISTYQEKDISREYLLLLMTKYRFFLLEKQKAGSGLTTKNETKQNTRTDYIEQIIQCFTVLAELQTVRHWEDLLMRLVRYRIALYTENKKWTSTFGDALRAVHVDLLRILNEAILKYSESVVLQELSEKIKKAPCMLNDLSDELEKQEVTRIYSAAFGCDDALKAITTTTPKTSRFPFFSSNTKGMTAPYPKALTAPSTQVNKFIAQLKEDTHQDRYENFFKETSGNLCGENPLNKKRRMSIA